MMNFDNPLPAERRIVREFYRDMPFNYHGSPDTAAEHIRKNPITAYPDLDTLLEEEEIRDVLEIGCGAGWAANSIALHYGKNVTALDFTKMALDRAAEVSTLVGTENRVRFVHSDLFEFDTQERFDLVASIGVLHHTDDCRAAFNHITRFIAPGGYLFLGLYHYYGRRPFLDILQGIYASEGETAALARFRTMMNYQSDEIHLLSWFRDQVLHPHETQHTLEEVIKWLDEAGLKLCSTNLNGYEDTDDHPKLIEQEKHFEALSISRNGEENSYFPGFFTVLAQRLD